MNSTNSTPSSISTEDDPKRWIALIVDDQDDNLAIAKTVLNFHGAQVHSAQNGEVGLEVLRTIRPTFILLDLSMPVLDGWEMLRKVRANPEISDLPIIALTAHAMDGDRERVLAAGFDGYISKPFDVQTLVPYIRRVIGHLAVSRQTKVSALGA
jgi:CheY-like chemotaxis protein